MAAGKNGSIKKMELNDKGDYIMLLKDIQKFICSEVNLYATSSALSKQRLFEGFCDDVPEKFLNQKIISIEAENDCMGIYIDMDCEKLSEKSRYVTSPKRRRHDENFDDSLLEKRIEILSEGNIYLQTENKRLTDELSYLQIMYDDLKTEKSVNDHSNNEKIKKLESDVVYLKSGEALKNAMDYIEFLKNSLEETKKYYKEELRKNHIKVN